MFTLAGNTIRAEDVNTSFPSASIANPTHEFEPVVDGTQVFHEYPMQNKGLATLIIEKVKTDWGCTAVSYPRQIPAGGGGIIKIKADTSGYGGKRLTKNIRIETNDRKNPLLTLTITGVVEKLATISPRRVQLIGAANQDIQAFVVIIPEEKYAFNIVGTSVKSGEFIRYQLNEVKQTKGIVYQLVVENIRKTKGRYVDTIYLRTTSKFRPMIKIPIYGNIT